MGCCQSDRLGTEVIFSQSNTVDDGESSDKFKEVPLSSSNSPLRYTIIQEEIHGSAIRLSYETTSSSNIPNSRISLELAFVCSKV